MFGFFQWLLIFLDFCPYFLGVWQHGGRGIWHSLLFPSCWKHRQGSGLNYMPRLSPNIQLFFEWSPTFKQTSLSWLHSILFPAVRTAAAGRYKVLDSSSQRCREKRGKSAVSVLCTTETNTCKKNINKCSAVCSKTVTSVEKGWENQKPTISINYLYSSVACWLVALPINSEHKNQCLDVRTLKWLFSFIVQRRLCWTECPLS